MALLTGGAHGGAQSLTRLKVVANVAAECAAIVNTLADALPFSSPPQR
jgi:hypothetical protein